MRVIQENGGGMWQSDTVEFNEPSACYTFKYALRHQSEQQHCLQVEILGYNYNFKMHAHATVHDAFYFKNLENC